MLTDMASKLFADLFDDEAMRRARAGVWPADAWRAIEQVGLPLACPRRRAASALQSPTRLGWCGRRNFMRCPCRLPRR